MGVLLFRMWMAHTLISSSTRQSGKFFLNHDICMAGAGQADLKGIVRSDYASEICLAGASHANVLVLTLGGYPVGSWSSKHAAWDMGALEGAARRLGRQLGR
eukprot:jgi/Ulvmu1/8760/UM048_0014.1